MMRVLTTQIGFVTTLQTPPATMVDKMYSSHLGQDFLRHHYLVPS